MNQEKWKEDRVHWEITRKLNIKTVKVKQTNGIYVYKWYSWIYATDFCYLSQCFSNKIMNQPMFAKLFQIHLYLCYKDTRCCLGERIVFPIRV